VASPAAESILADRDERRALDLAKQSRPWPGPPSVVRESLRAEVGVLRLVERLPCVLSPDGNVGAGRLREPHPLRRMVHS
jgi:hypothetical protein